MNAELSILVNRLNNPVLQQTEIITWGCPVPSFGNLSAAKIATLGLNPSNKEFVDDNGKELAGKNRRFHTLKSLGLENWTDIEEEHIKLIIEGCYGYFNRNPYDSWFKKLDNIISGTTMSYYFPSGKACHLDLIPYATSCKWTDLSSQQKSLLLNTVGDILGLLINKSSIELLILNGQTVVDNLERISQTKFKKMPMAEWTLPRKSNEGVLGYAYKGSIKQLVGIKLNRKIQVLGFNHNIQSSFGVTKQIQTSIRNWISHSSKEIFNETR